MLVNTQWGHPPHAFWPMTTLGWAFMLETTDNSKQQLNMTFTFAKKIDISKYIDNSAEFLDNHIIHI